MVPIADLTENTSRYYEMYFVLFSICTVVTAVKAMHWIFMVQMNSHSQFL
jgi:hypothetical protein